MFVVQKNIPLPTKNGTGEIDMVVSQMDVGDSVLTPYKAAGSCISFTHASRRLGRPTYKFNARKEGNGARVWRVA